MTDKVACILAIINPIPGECPWKWLSLSLESKKWADIISNTTEVEYCLKKDWDVFMYQCRVLCELLWSINLWPFSQLHEVLLANNEPENSEKNKTEFFFFYLITILLNVAWLYAINIEI